MLEGRLCHVNIIFTYFDPQEKEQLQRENDDLKNEVSKLKEDSMFTKSPKR
jgi:hypothetical protein